jgi:hypothetical protein
VTELLYIGGAVEASVGNSEVGGDEVEVGVQSVLEDDNELSIESEGDGDRERDGSLVRRLREGMLCCLSTQQQSCGGDQILEMGGAISLRRELPWSSGKAVTTIS